MISATGIDGQNLVALKGHFCALQTAIDTQSWAQRACYRVIEVRKFEINITNALTTEVNFSNLFCTSI
jgi:hypothetical protein